MITSGTLLEQKKIFISYNDFSVLQITLERVLPYFETNIAPMVKSGKRVVIAAHGNSLRALGKYMTSYK